MNPERVRMAARIGPDRAAVLVPLPVASAYDYAVPEGVPAHPGRFVRVPLGKRVVTGVVWGEAEGAVAPSRLREIEAVLDVPPLGEDLRRTIAWTAAYTLSAPGAVLRMAMSVPEALDPPKRETAFVASSRAIPEGPRVTDASRRLTALLADGRPRRMADIARQAGVSASVVHRLVEAGAVRSVSLSLEEDPPIPDWRRAGARLTGPQAAAAACLRAQISAGGARTITLLDGVTGSGKTEVYFEAIAAALARRRQVLVLLPEIALTVDWLRRFERRFGAPPCRWHSEIGRPRRRETWRAVAAGKARVVVGARSALFLPFRELGLILVDEEHDSSFKQEDGVIYNARDIAIVRARDADCPIVLSSATPSLETTVNVRRGRYRRVHLPDPVRRRRPAEPGRDRHARRGHGAAIPGCRPACAMPPGRGSARGEQVLFYLNRRGYAPLTLCRGCGHRFACPNCTAWLVDHRLAGRLQCHHCGFAAPPPSACPECGAGDGFAACGPGVERLSEEAQAAFPGARDRADVIGFPARAGRGRGAYRPNPRPRVRSGHRHPARRQGPRFPPT